MHGLRSLKRYKLTALPLRGELLKKGVSSNFYTNRFSFNDETRDYLTSTFTICKNVLLGVCKSIQFGDIIKKSTLSKRND